MTRETPDTARRPQRWVLPALALLFLGPLAAAWFFYFAGDDWRPGASVNHGQLINPAVPLELVAAGEFGELRGQWLLLVSAVDGCDEACVAVLDKVRRVRLALREKAPRVNRLLLHSGDLPDSPGLQALREGLQTLGLETRAGGVLARQLAVLAPAGNEKLAVFIVDPLGNAVLVFTPDFTMRGMLADLKRLLKLSRIG